MRLQTSSLGLLLPGGGAFGPGPPVWVEEATGGCFCGRASMEVEHMGHHQGPGRISCGSGCSWLGWGRREDASEPRSGVCAAGQVPARRGAALMSCPDVFPACLKIHQNPFPHLPFPKLGLFQICL